MLNYEFVVWLEGFLDLCEESSLTVKKLRVIRNHLNLVVAVEGSLGLFNQEIYDLISECIEKDTPEMERLKETLKGKLQDFLREAFPVSTEV